MFREQATGFNEMPPENKQTLHDRREFLKCLVEYGGIIAGSEILINSSDVSAAETKADTQYVWDMARESHEGGKQRIEYQIYKEHLSPAADQAMRNIASYHEKLLHGQGDVAANTGGIEIQRGSDVVLERRKIQRELWEDLVAIPEIREQCGHGNADSFSSAALGEMVFKIIPKFFAKEGVYAKASPQGIMNERTGETLMLDPVVEFRPVRQIDDLELKELWGKEFNSSIVAVDVPMLLDGKPFPLPFAIGNEAEAVYGNIVVRVEVLQKRYEKYEKMKADPMDLDEVVTKETDFLKIYRYSVEKDADLDEFFQTRTSCRYLKGIQNKEEFVKWRMQHILPHEAKHIQDAEDPSFPSFPENPAGNDYFIQNTRISIHEEINGFLSEMRYTQNDPGVLLSLLFTNNLRGDPTHAAASHWLREQVVELLAANPEKYDVRVYEEIPLSPSEQLRHQITLTVEKHPEYLPMLAEEIMSIHRAHYNDDLVAKYLPQFIPEKLTPPVSSEKSNLIGIGGVVIGLGALGIGMKKFFDRRERVALEEARQKQAKTNRRRKK